MKKLSITVLIVAAVFLLMPYNCKYADAGDVTASVTVNWTTPFDDVGVTGYDMRYRESHLDSATWDDAIVINPDSLPVPGLPGSLDSVKLSLLLQVGASYQFAIKTFDSSGNYSDISNVDGFVVVDSIPPTVVNDLAVTVTY